jgi:F0F1-type ATP synthase epsilon subunit
MNYLKSKFSQVDVKVELTAKSGEITVSEYEEKILEALKQAGVRLKKAK